MNNKEKGNLAEKKAILFLIKQNFQIIEQNFYAKKLGEIDIIALKDNIYHFIEVKSASSYEIAINNITPSKLSKIKRSLIYYIQTKNISNPYCIDVIILSKKDIDFIENITI